MSGLDYFKKCVTTHYAEFNGRARRSEYWYFVLFQILIMILPLILLVTGEDSNSGSLSTLGYIGMGLLAVIAVALIIPNIAVTVRRLHDTNKSGWWYLITFVPFGSLILLVFMLMTGNAGSNNYGSDPKGDSEDLLDLYVED